MSNDTSEQFFVTLPSSASSAEFPRNTNDSFRVRLARKLDLNLNEWDVSLSSIIYPNKFHNVDCGRLRIDITVAENNFMKEVTLKNGWYKFPSTLIRTLNQSLSETTITIEEEGEEKEKTLSNFINFSYNNISGNATITIKEKVNKVSVSEDLQEYLGFESEYGQGIFIGERQVDPMRGFSAMYVYCDIVEPWFVGDAMTSLLRIVPVSAVYGDISLDFIREQFNPVSSFKQDVLQVDIRKDNGKKVSFVDGKIVLTLCFQRRRRS